MRITDTRKLLIAYATAAVLILNGCSLIIGRTDADTNTDNTTTATSTDSKGTDTSPDTTTPNTTTPKTTTPVTTSTKPVTQPVTTPAQTEPSTTAAPDTTASGYDGIMKLNNDRKNWSHEYPDDLSEYGGMYRGQEGNIYLTFDLGYEFGYTQKILDVLKEKNVKAVFFLTGQYIRDNRAIVDRMKREGHKIGCHGYDHTNMITLTSGSPDPLIEDFDKWEAIYGAKPDLYRAPEGAYSTRGMAMIHELGYRTVFWGAAYADWDENNQMPEDEAFKAITERTQSGEIVLIHPFRTNSLILGRYIDWARSKGWKVSQIR